MSMNNTRASNLKLRATPRVLSVAGTDPTGGAGIHADLKSIAANGGYGMAVVTSLVAQNTRGVGSIHTPPAHFLQQQLNAVSADVTIDAVKIGMLGDLSVIAEVRTWLEVTRPPLVVLDPVLVATSGDRLLDPVAEQALRDLVPLVDLVTPNILELGVLVRERSAINWAEAVEQGRRLSSATGVTVLVKGGHFAEPNCPDALVNMHGLLTGDVVEVTAPRVNTRNTHGTGCSLSAAMATVQARTGNWSETLVQVKAWIQDALLHADTLEVGEGSGPINHFHHLFADRGPAGTEFSESLWRDIAPIRAAIFDLPFVTELGDGTLAEPDFSYYLAQDALYLSTYSRVLARASALAPTQEAQAFWANSARECLQVESDLHRRWLKEHRAPRSPGPVTKAYLDHLLATSAQGSYAVLVAAILPCYWLYAVVGAQLHAQFVAMGEGIEHPYADWLTTYADEAFAEATQQAIAFTDAAARDASRRERTAMRAAFLHSSQFEIDFFDAPRRHAQG
jgi:hydroxymethylpyrimidine/phosphomethylpyrimidine kinase